MNIDNYVLIKLSGFFQGFLRRGLRCLITTLLLVLTAQSVFALRLNEVVPDFEARIYAESTQEESIRFHEWIDKMEEEYVILFSHPKDFTPVCTTELAKVEELMPEFKRLKTRVIGLSADNYEDHQEWAKDIAKVAGSKKETLSFPLIVDDSLQVAMKFGMLPKEAEPGKGRTPEQNKTIRSLFLIGKDKRLKLSIQYPMNIGSNFDEVLRVVELSLLIGQEEGRVVSPAYRKESSASMIVAPMVSTQEGWSRYGRGISVSLPSRDTGKPDYLRYVKMPELRLSHQDSAQAETDTQTGEGEESKSGFRGDL